MRRLIHFLGVLSIVGLTGLSLGGCATPIGQKVGAVASAISGASVDPQAVIVASNVFDGLQRTATNYLRLKRCGPSTTVICRDPAATPQIIKAIRAGRVARNNLQLFLKTHPGQLGPQGLYDTLQAANATLQEIFATYKIGGAS